MTELLPAIGRHSFEQVRDWAVGACESAVAEEREGLMLAVADHDGSLHTWALDWAHMSNDENAFGYCRDELSRHVDAVGGVAHALFIPAWIGDDGTVWALAPEEDPPRHDYEQAMVLSVACHDERTLLVGLVDAGPPRRLGRWERTRTRTSDAEALALRH